MKMPKPQGPSPEELAAQQAEQARATAEAAKIKADRRAKLVGALSGASGRRSLLASANTGAGFLTT